MIDAPVNAIDRVIAWSAVAAFIGCAFFAFGIPPVPDHGYQFHLAERILAGARLYIDVAAADMHPPLVTWIDAGIVLVGRMFGVAGLTLYPLFVMVCAGYSVAGTLRFTPRSDLLPAILVLLLIPLAGAHFGQGEHIALLLALPYLAAAAREPEERGATRLRLTVAALAAIGLSFKPHFALIWIGVELWLWHVHGRTSLRRAENLVIAGIFALYIMLTALFTPQFFGMLPWLMALYPRVAHRSTLDMLVDWRTLLFASAMVVTFFQSGDYWGRFVRVIGIAALAMFFSLVLQSKGWGYHWFPVVVFSLLLLILAARPFHARWRYLAPVVAVIAIFMMAGQPARTARLIMGPPGFLGDFLQLSDTHAPGRPVLILSIHLNPAFPFVNIADAEWNSPYGHLWMVPALYAEAWRGEADLRYREVGRWETVEQQMFDGIWEGVQRGAPGLLVVDGPFKNGFDMRSYFSTDPRFRALFEGSTLVGRIGHYVVYLPRSTP